MLENLKREEPFEELFNSSDLIVDESQRKVPLVDRPDKYGAWLLKQFIPSFYGKVRKLNVTQTKLSLFKNHIVLNTSIEFANLNTSTKIINTLGELGFTQEAGNLSHYICKKENDYEITLNLLTQHEQDILELFDVSGAYHA